MATYSKAIQISGVSHFAVNSPAGNSQTSLATLYIVPAGRYATVTMHYYKTTANSFVDGNGFVGAYDSSANRMFRLYRAKASATLPGTYTPEHADGDTAMAAGDNKLVVVEQFNLGPGGSIRWQKATATPQLDFALTVVEFASEL
jgi:hypothetical protein